MRKKKVLPPSSVEDIMLNLSRYYHDLLHGSTYGMSGNLAAAMHGVSFAPKEMISDLDDACYKASRIFMDGDQFAQQDIKDLVDKLTVFNRKYNDSEIQRIISDLSTFVIP